MDFSSKILLLLILSTALILNNVMADGEDSNDKKVNEYIFCKIDSDSEECPPDYTCQKSNANEAPGSGVCYLTECKKEGTECLHDTECCRKDSETNMSPLDCLNGICQVLMP